MEVAGLVLGAYPAAIIVFEQCKRGARYYANWARFRRKYEAFIRDMEGQQLFFEGILQDLMCGGPDPFLPAADSKDKFLEIVNDSTFTGWRNPVLISRLKSRLDNRYDWCIYTIKRIYDILEDLGEIMNTQELMSSEHTADWWRLQWERISQALFTERYEGHTEAKRLIEELGQMVELSDKHRSQGARILASLNPIFKKIWQTSNNLYEVLKAAWHCHCRVSHQALLQLEQRLETTSCDFHLLFILPSNSTPGDKADSSAFTEMVEQEVQVVVSEPIESEPQSGQRLSSPTPAPKQDTTLAVKPNPPKNLGPKSQLSPPSIVTKSSQSSMKSGASDSTGKFSFFSSDSKFRCVMQACPTGKEMKKWKLFRGNRQGETGLTAIKPMPATKEKRISVTITKFTVSNSTRNQTRIDEEPVSKPSKHATVTQNATQLQAQSDTPPSSPLAKAASKVLIADLCDTMRVASAATPLGYFVDRSKSQLDFMAGDRSMKASTDAASIRLDQVLEGKIVKPYQFSPEKRAALATILASSLVQLQRTHWLKSHWTKKDIVFKTRGGTVLFDQPYISRDFMSSKLISKDTHVKTPPDTDTPPNFNPKTSLESLGILLTELCFGVPIEAHQDKVRVRPMDSSIESNHEFCLAIARAWTWEEIRAQDPLFSDPINSYFNFPGLRRFEEGRADEVMNDVYELIVRPLYAETVRRWPPQTRGASS